jgi:hypothetical protein
MTTLLLDIVAVKPESWLRFGVGAVEGLFEIVSAGFCGFVFAIERRLGVSTLEGVALPGVDATKTGARSLGGVGRGLLFEN